MHRIAPSAHLRFYHQVAPWQKFLAIGTELTSKKKSTQAICIIKHYLHI